MTLTCWTSVTEDLYNQHHFKVDSQDQCHSSVSYQMWNMISIPPSAPEMFNNGVDVLQNIMTSQWRWPSTFMVLNVNTLSLYLVRHLCEVLSWSVHEFLSQSGNVFCEVTATIGLQNNAITPPATAGAKAWKDEHSCWWYFMANNGTLSCSPFFYWLMKWRKYLFNTPAEHYLNAAHHSDSLSLLLPYLSDRYYQLTELSV